MSKPRSRTAEEREAARRERERRRAARRGEPPPASALEPAPAAPEAVPREPEPAAAEPAAFTRRAEPEPPEPELAEAVPEPDPEPEPPEPVPEPQAPAPVPEPQAPAPVPLELASAGPDPTMQTHRETPAALPLTVVEAQEDPDELSDDPDADVPSGTRRVSGLERAPQRRPLRRRQPPQRRPRRVKVPQSDTPGGPTSRTGRILSVAAIAVAAALAWFLAELFQPFHGAGGAPVRVTIPPHLSSSQVGDLLARDGIISSGFFFELRATLAGERSHLRAGTYELRRGMSYGDALKVLTTPPPPVPTTSLTLVEGQSRRQIDALLRSQGIRGSYLLATRRSPLLKPAAYGAPRSTPSLEGFLFPSTFLLRKPVRISDLVAKQLRAFKQQFAGVSLSYAGRHHLTAYDVLIIASIIEKEAATAHDRSLVASVIYNRLADHMPLGMDSTTRYQFNDYTHPLTNAQLQSPSPYNTRTHAGLPPTPIGNPGLSAIRAAANPPPTHYLYFVVKPCGNGASVFSSSYQQFLQDSARYQAARNHRGGRSPSHC